MVSGTVEGLGEVKVHAWLWVLRECSVFLLAGENLASGVRSLSAFGFRISVFSFWVSVFGVLVLGSWFRVSSFGLRLSGFGGVKSWH